MHAVAKRFLLQTMPSIDIDLGAAWTARHGESLALPQEVEDTLHDADAAAAADFHARLTAAAAQVTGLVGLAWLAALLTLDGDTLFGAAIAWLTTGAVHRLTMTTVDSLYADIVAVVAWPQTLILHWIGIRQACLLVAARIAAREALLARRGTGASSPSGAPMP